MHPVADNVGLYDGTQQLAALRLDQMQMSPPPVSSIETPVPTPAPLTQQNSSFIHARYTTTEVMLPQSIILTISIPSAQDNKELGAPKRQKTGPRVLIRSTKEPTPIHVLPSLSSCPK